MPTANEPLPNPHVELNNAREDARQEAAGRLADAIEKLEEAKKAEPKCCDKCLDPKTRELIRNVCPAAMPFQNASRETPTAGKRKHLTKKY